MLIYFIIALNFSKLCYFFCRNVEFFKITLIHQQNVEVKNVNGIKRRQTKRCKKKRWLGQNVEWKKRRQGQQ